MIYHSSASITGYLFYYRDVGRDQQNIIEGKGEIENYEGRELYT